MRKSTSLKFAASLAADAASFAMPTPTQPHVCHDPACDENLKAEYELIKQKKSNLPAAERAKIVRIMEAEHIHE